MNFTGINGQSNIFKSLGISKSNWPSMLKFQTVIEIPAMRNSKLKKKYYLGF